jgi:Domain of unknown function (DUF4397)
MLRRLLSCLLPLAAALFAAACDDDPPTGNMPPPATTTTAPPAAGGGFLRAAQLSEDARSIDFVVNGAVLATGIDYGSVGPYAPLDSGEYRVQFFSEGDRTVPIVETRFTLGSNQAVTVALVGESSAAFSFVHERSTRSDRARLTMVNTVPDYPAPFDLVVQNGPGVFDGVGYLQSSGTTDLIPGVYGFELRRGGTAEEVAAITGQAMSGGANYTVFAFGTLSRDDIELLLTRDTF